MKIYSVGIKFPDNDFGHTIRGFLENIRIIMLENQELPKSFTKLNIVKCYNASIYGFYLLYQNKFEYPISTSISLSLDIIPEQVYFNEEILKYIELDNLNHDFHYYDLYSDKIYTV